MNINFNEEYIFNFLNQSKTRFSFEPDIDMQQSLCKVETKFTRPSDLALNKHVHLLLLIPYSGPVLCWMSCVLTSL